jgi:urease accessory protein
MMTPAKNPLRVGIGGPVGSGKTALMDGLCKAMRGRFELVAITTTSTRGKTPNSDPRRRLPPERIRGVETGGCPHTAIRGRLDQPRRGRRDDAAVPGGRCRADRSGGDNLAGDVLASSNSPI